MKEPKINFSEKNVWGKYFFPDNLLEELISSNSDKDEYFKPLGINKETSEVYYDFLPIRVNLRGYFCFQKNQLEDGHKTIYRAIRMPECYFFIEMIKYRVGERETKTPSGTKHNVIHESVSFKSGMINGMELLRLVYRKNILDMPDIDFEKHLTLMTKFLTIGISSNRSVRARDSKTLFDQLKV